MSLTLSYAVNLTRKQDRIDGLERELKRTKEELSATDESLRVVRSGMWADGGITQTAEKLVLENEVSTLSHTNPDLDPKSNLGP